MSKIKIRTINTSGNVTLFVTSHVDEKDYANVAEVLLSKEELGGEQVAFVVDENTMCMCGHEFCGNASRAFALMKGKGILGSVSDSRTVTINTSGVQHPVDVEVDTVRNYTKIRMPNPVAINKIDCGFGQAYDIVDLDGIMHVIAGGIEPSLENFNAIKDKVMEAFNPPAMGVMFVDDTARTEQIKMTPVVYVDKVKSTFFEGSCGSGSTALGAVMSRGKPDGTYVYDIHQPKGDIRTTAEIRNGALTAIYIEGAGELSEEKYIEI